VEILGWTLAILLMAVGFLGNILPVLPGNVLIFVGAIVHRLCLGEQQSIGWGTIIGLLVLLLVSSAIDFVSGALGAKVFGASRWAALGAIAGAIVGFFFGIIGLIVGPVIGVLIVEIVVQRKLVAAGKASVGTVIGAIGGMIGKLLIGALMILWFALAVV
jgi:uncharacterized protein YqgC (DUF456 family)